MTDHDGELAGFVQAHGEVIGYDMDGAFIPVPRGDARAIRIHEEALPGLAATLASGCTGQ